MKILISGAGGLVGTALAPHLSGQGHAVRRLARSNPSGEDILWNPEQKTIDAAKLEGFEGVVHLAGESIASGRWTEERKKRIRDSRVLGTRFLVEALGRLAQRPKIFLCASAIGFYGDRGDEVLREESPPGSLFLSQVCRDWEEAAAQAASSGMRVVRLRFGMILSAHGGALAKMLLPFRLGLGGKIGSGAQYMSWVSIEDTVGAIAHALNAESLRGPVNVVAPNPVSNLEFTKTLGKVLGRPTVFPMPAFAARLAFGQMADELLLASARVQPAKLASGGYHFKHPQLEGALRDLLPS